MGLAANGMRLVDENSQTEALGQPELTTCGESPGGWRPGSTPAHRHDASLARLSIPDEDRQRAGHAIGNVVLFCAGIVTTIALRQRLRERVDFASRCLGCELAAHGLTLSSLMAVVAYWEPTGT